MYKSCDICGNEDALHPQKHIQFQNKHACVDEGIADLIQTLWENGIRTNGSCHGKECPPACVDPYCRVDYAYIILRNAQMMEDFIQLLEDHGIKKDYLLNKHYSDQNYNFTIVNNFKDLHSTRIKKRLSWRWEMLNKPSTEDNFITKELTPPEFENNRRWELRFPVVDLKPLTYLLKRKPITVKSIVQTLPSSEGYFGALHIDKGVITGFGAYLGVNTFNPEPFIMGYERMASSIEEFNLTLEEFIAMAKQDYHDHLERVIVGSSDLTSLLRDIKKSKVYLSFQEDALTLGELANLKYEY